MVKLRSAQSTKPPVKQSHTVHTSMQAAARGSRAERGAPLPRAATSSVKMMSAEVSGFSTMFRVEAERSIASSGSKSSRTER